MSFTINSTIQRTAIILALLTSLGILVHDTKFDKALSVFIALPAALALTGVPKLASEGHNHVERVSSDSIRHLSGMPRIQPRNDHKSIAMPKKVSKGVHAFDGYYQPLGEL